MLFQPLRKANPCPSGNEEDWYAISRRDLGGRDWRRRVILAMSITYLEAIREAQAKRWREDQRVFIYGQDVGSFGGAFKATKDLAKEFPGRVSNAPISEDAMVGTGHRRGESKECARSWKCSSRIFPRIGFNQILNHAATHYWRTNVPCPITVRLPSGGTAGSGPFHARAWKPFMRIIPA